MSDSIEMGSTEIPDVLPTLAALLPKYEGEALEAQLQIFDTFLGILAPSARSRIADLLRNAAAQAPEGPVRERVSEAASEVAIGGRAAAPYDHAGTTGEYAKSFQESYANTPSAKAAPTPSRGKKAHPKILAQLDLIEAEMKRIGRWSDHPPDLLAAAERGEVKTYLDAPTFELWLQALFIPRARQAALDDELPSGSQVGEMARRQYDYMSVDDNAAKLRQLLQHFDELITYANRKRV